jgi:hypothetical protein
MSQMPDELNAKHTVPVIDRMMDILAYLERSPDGVIISQSSLLSPAQPSTAF